MPILTSQEGVQLTALDRKVLSQRNMQAVFLYAPDFSILRSTTSCESEPQAVYFVSRSLPDGGRSLLQENGSVLPKEQGAEPMWWLLVVLALVLIGIVVFFNLRKRAILRSARIPKHRQSTQGSWVRPDKARREQFTEQMLAAQRRMQASGELQVPAQQNLENANWKHQENDLRRQEDMRRQNHYPHPPVQRTTRDFQRRPPADNQRIS